jgi:hypothetical protein
MMDNEKVISGLQIDWDSISDQSTRIIIRHLLNIVESQAEEIKKLRDENQHLRDENNRLKGEQGRPKIRKQSSSDKKDSSSEGERKNRGPKKSRKLKSKKKKTLTVHKIERCEIDKSQLPADAVFKGYQSTIIQDIIITPNNIQFDKEIYYSPSLKKTFVAPLPDGYSGDFGPNIKALILDMHHHENMTETSIHRFLSTHGVDISTASISRILTNNHELFHQEKEDIVSAGLQSTTHQQMDDTGARINGKNHYTHILCNDYYTAYFTRPDKTRLTIIDILAQGDVQFHFNESVYFLMEQMQISKKMLHTLKAKNPKSVMVRAEVDTLLSDLLPIASKQQTNRQIILEASAIVGYQSRSDAVKILLADDAPQFRQITELLALCWVHDGRHYKKLTPAVPLHRVQLKEFLTKYWDYYHELLQYKKTPSEQLAKTLAKQFDDLFSTVTGYQHLDDRIKKTKQKKDSLLLVLRYPELPLHNNTSELGARKQARYRDISFHTMNKKGTEAKDTFMTIIQTAKKLGLNTFKYLRDRISKKQIPSLVEQILNKVSAG